MDTNLLETITKLRLYIGYLGEKDQFGWWVSSFFAPSSNAFFEPLFGRTQYLAQCNGVTRAAALVHDERIGVGHVYHLFRLPEDLEQGLHRELHDPKFGNMKPPKRLTVAATDCRLNKDTHAWKSKHPDVRAMVKTAV